MSILESILIVFFVLLMIFFIVGFNRQMNEKSKLREERFKKRARKNNEDE
ncbi:hypothetical protein [Campylobacter aviculae]|nr:hypothetical protein [Campylobacter aviculae]